MSTPLEIEEYKAKWEYVRHTETLRARELQWYLGIVGGVLAFTFAGDESDFAISSDERWIPLAFLAVYSALVDRKSVG